MPPVKSTADGATLPTNRRVRRAARGSGASAVAAKAIDPTLGGEEASEPRSGVSGDAVRAACSVILTIGIAVGFMYGLVRYTRTSPRFAIRNIEIHGAERRSAAELAKAGGLETGSNIFAANLEAARVSILQDPWIEKATLSRRLPGSVRIEVVEREAVALVALGPSLYLTTRQGELFKRYEPGDPFDLPTVTGVSPAEVARDRAGVAAVVQRALDLAAEYERVGPKRTLPVQEVHVEDDGALSLVVSKEPIVLRMGKGPFRQPVEQAARVLAEVGARGADARMVFLDNEAHPERVVVRMR